MTYHGYSDLSVSLSLTLIAFVGHVWAASSIFSHLAPLSFITCDLGFTLAFLSTANTDGAIVSQLQQAIHRPGSTFTETSVSFSCSIGSGSTLEDADLTFS